MCRSCRREHADQDLHELESHMTALRRGSEPFDIYTAAERKEHLKRLGLLHGCFPEVVRKHAIADGLCGGPAPDAATRAEIELRDEIESRLETELVEA